MSLPDVVFRTAGAVIASGGLLVGCTGPSSAPPEPTPPPIQLVEWQEVNSPAAGAASVGGRRVWTACYPGGLRLFAMTSPAGDGITVTETSAVGTEGRCP